MKIVSWNCNGKFREKYREIAKLRADIYVIEECENPDQQDDPGYRAFAENALWIGEKPSKGLGIFADESIRLSPKSWPNYCLRNFLPVNINGKFDLLGVWACRPYIEEYCVYQAIHKEKYTPNMVIIGDFNSNKIWDRGHGPRNHSAVVRELNDMGLISAYHYVTGEEQGEELQNTFYMYRHKDRGFHIDYCFTNRHSIRAFQVLSSDVWLKYSDHMPIVLDMAH